MPIPQQVTDRIKEAPAVVLRAVFAGIGQLLMAADKIRAQLQEQATSSPAHQQRPSTAQPPRPPADETGSVTPLRERPAPAAEPAPEPGAAPTLKTTVPKPAAASAAKTAAHTKPTAAAKAAGPKPAAASPKPATAPKPAAATPKPATAPKPAAASPKPAAAAAQAPPIPGYDDLSIASLRARLRGLDAAGVQALLDYEKANAKRDDVITMFERRLSKIEDGTG